MTTLKSEKRASEAALLGMKLLQSVREMKAGLAARETVVAVNEVLAARQGTGLSQAEFAEAVRISKRRWQQW